MADFSKEFLEKLEKIPQPTRFPTDVIDFQELEAEEQKEREEYVELMQEYDEIVEQNWVRDYTQRTGRTPRKPHKELIDWTRLLKKEERVPSRLAVSITHQLKARKWSKEEREAARDFVDFYDKLGKKRFEALPQSLKQFEVKLGGVHGDKFLIDSFVAGLIDNLTFGIVDTNHPIYGSAYKDYNQGAYTGGNILGEIMMFMTLSQIASATKVPEKLVRLAGKSEAARRVLHTLGKPKVLLGNKLAPLNVMFRNMAPKYAFGSVQAGAQGATTGLIKAFSGTTRHLVKQFKTEDKMKVGEWLKTVPVSMKEFALGYGISLINDPRGWSARFFLDGLWSGAKQGSEILLGQRDSWDMGDFWKDFMLGHILGEVQGAVFSPNKSQINKMLTQASAKRTADYFVKNGIVANYDEAFYPTQVLEAVRIETASRGRMPTDVEMDQLRVSLGEQFKNDIGIQKGLYNPDVKVLTLKDYTKVMQGNRDNAYANLRDSLRLTGVFSNKLKIDNALERNKFKSFLREMRNNEKVIVEEIKPITKEDLLRRVKSVNFGYFSKKIHNALGKRFKGFFKGIETEEGKISKTLELLRRDEVPKETKTKPSKTLITDQKIDEQKQRIYKLSTDNRERLTRGFGNLEKRDYTSDDALSDFIVKVFEGDKAFFVSNEKLKGWLTNDKTILATIRRQIRNNLINFGKKTKQIQRFEPLENVISDQDMRRLHEAEGTRDGNPMYSILLSHLRQKGKVPIVRSVARYLKGIGLNNKAILQRFKEAGVNIKPSSLRQYLYEINKDIDSILKTGRTQINVFNKQKFTDAEIKQIWDDSREMIEDLNPVTGLRQDLREDGDAINLIKKNTGYIVSVTDLHSKLAITYNKNIADSVLQNTGRIINDLVNEINLAYSKQKGTKIYVKNPTDFNNTKFVLYQRGLTPDEFKDNISYINRILENNYLDDDYGKKFSFIVKKVDNSHEILDKIDVDVSQTKNVRDLVGEVAELETDLPGWKKADISAKDDIILEPAKTDRPGVSEQFKRIRQQRFKEMDPEHYVTTKIIKDLDTMDDISSNWINAERMTEKQKRTVKGLFKQGLETAKFEVSSFLNEYFTIWHGLEIDERHMSTISAVYRAASLMKDGGNFARDILESEFKGIFDNLSKTQQRGLNNNIIHALEQEQGRIISKTTGKPIVTPNAITEPVELKSGVEINLEGLKNKVMPLKDFVITSTFIKGKLPATRLLHYLYDIPSDKLIKFYQANHKTGKVLENLSKAGLLPALEDKEFTWAERIKQRMRDETVKILLNYTQEDLTNFDFDARGSREKIQQIINRIPDTRLRQQAQINLKWYYKIDPETITYVPHLDMEDPITGRKINGAIEDILHGRTTRGEAVLNPIMKEIKGRKYATLEQLMENGYKVSEEGYLEQLWAELNYVKNKLDVFAMMDTLKLNYMEQFVAAKERGLLTEFLRSRGGYFYIPTKDEFVKMKGFITDVDKKIAHLQTLPQNTAILKQITNFTAMKSQVEFRRNMMREILKTWRGLDASNLANLVTEQNVFVPLNRRAYENSVESIPLELRNQIKTYLKKHNIRAHNIPEGDGLYFNRIIFKGLNQFVFKDHFLDRSDEPLIRRLVGYYDKVNTKLKAISFWKPQILFANDMIQLLRADPTAVSRVPRGFKAVNDARDNVQTAEHDFYKRMDRNNLYNKSVSLAPVFTDGYRAVAQLMGKRPYLGAIMEEWTGDKNFFKKIWGSAAKVYKTQQELAWYNDEALRTALAMQVNDRFVKAYGQSKGDFVTAEWVNMHMVNYSRVPSATRQMLNRFLLFPTYRIGNIRYHKEMIKNAINTVGRAFGNRPSKAVAIPGQEGFKQGRFDPSYKVTERQGLFDVKPLIQSFILKNTVRAALGVFFGFGYEDIWDFMTGYRAKKKEGEDTIFDQEIQFLSLSTPLFELEKHFTRLRRNPKIWLRFNAAKFPGLMWSLITNTHPITARKMVTASWTKQPHKAFAQWSSNVLGAYLPILGDVSQLAEDDQDSIKKLINFSGLGFYYKHKSPKELLDLLNKALDKGTTVREHQRALNEFHTAIRRSYNVLFDEELKDISDSLQEQKDKIYDIKF